MRSGDASAALTGETAWTRANLSHVANMLRFGANPAARVYDSLGTAAFATLAPGWLNVGLWHSPHGDAAEAPMAPQRLVERLAAALPQGGTVLDVGNGLGVQEPVIARVARPSRLIAVNVTESQLHAGRSWLRQADALPVVADATRLPVRSGTVAGIVSVEAAFHFPSRRRFFAEALRVLRPGGVVSWSDVAVERLPRTPGDLLAGWLNARFWGIRAGQLASTRDIVGHARQAGLSAVAVDNVGAHTIDPFVRHILRTLDDDRDTPRVQLLAARHMLRQWFRLRRRGVIDYVIAHAVKAA